MRVYRYKMSYLLTSLKITNYRQMEFGQASCKDLDMAFG